MTDLERFFRHLVQTLSAADPARLRHPIPLAEIRSSILPYRTNRRALRLDTSEDYELVLMRLCAGEEALAHTNPEEARVRFAQELASPNPDLEVLRQFGDALVSLVPSRVVAAVAEDDDGEAVADAEVMASTEVTVPPPIDGAVEDAVGHVVDKPVAMAAVTAATSAAVRCVACYETLPSDQPVKFCPYCGKSQVPTHCSACGAELKSGWRFCPACGRGV